MQTERPMKLTQSYLDTPTGTMMLMTDEHDHIRLLEWTDHRARMNTLLARLYPGVAITIHEVDSHPVYTDALLRYFDGDIRALDKLPVAFGGTDFQRSVWQALRAIPAGQTWSYGQLAAYIGNPNAMRAVGLANGANPIAIIIPCHRVIGANGALTGYGGGMARKQFLLAHEGAWPHQLV